MAKLQWGNGHRVFSIFRRKQRSQIFYPIQLSPHDVFSHFSTSNLVTSSCIYPSSSWESESPWYLVTARVRKNEVKYLIFNIFRQKTHFWGIRGGMIKMTILQKKISSPRRFFWDQSWLYQSPPSGFLEFSPYFSPIFSNIFTNFHFWGV